jgi:acetyltransferase-like isoleucine patch superfamily enzyme
VEGDRRVEGEVRTAVEQEATVHGGEHVGRLERLPWWLRYRLAPRLASEVRRIAVEATHRHCTVRFAGPVWIGPGFALEIPDRGTLEIGAAVQFRRGFVCEISGNGRVVIGDGSIFTSHALVQCSTSIVVGQRCVFGQSVMLADGSHRFRDPTRHLLDQGYDFRPLTIGDGAVVMSKCTVTADVGAGTVVGAHSLVTKPLPAHCLAGGVPARVLADLAGSLAGSADGR